MDKEVKILFYCKDCRDKVDISRDQKKYVFTCKECGKKNIAYGTQESIKDFYHVKGTK